MSPTRLDQPPPDYTINPARPPLSADPDAVPARPFKLVSSFKPAGDQPQAIGELIAGFRGGERDQVLLGVTGSGKTFTAAHVIEQLQRPALIDRKSTRLNSSHVSESRMPSSA